MHDRITCHKFCQARLEAQLGEMRLEREKAESLLRSCDLRHDPRFLLCWAVRIGIGFGSMTKLQMTTFQPLSTIITRDKAPRAAVRAFDFL